MAQWEYLVVPLKDAAGLKRNSEGLTPDRLNALGSEGWEAEGRARHFARLGEAGERA